MTRKLFDHTEQNFALRNTRPGWGPQQQQQQQQRAYDLFGQPFPRHEGSSRSQPTTSDFDYIPSNIMSLSPTSYSYQSIEPPTSASMSYASRLGDPSDNWVSSSQINETAGSFARPGSSITPQRHRYAMAAERPQTDPGFIPDFEGLDFGRRRGPASVSERISRNHFLDRTSEQFPPISALSLGPPFSFQSSSPLSQASSMPSFAASDLSQYAPVPSQARARSPLFSTDVRAPVHSSYQTSSSYSRGTARRNSRVLSREQPAISLHEIGAPASNPRPVRKLRCDFEGCTHPPMKCQSDLKKHKARHENVHTCDVTDCARRIKGFATINDLDRHRHCVHGIEPAHGIVKNQKCFAPNCPKHDKIWPRLDNFRNHLQRMHKDMDEDWLVARGEQWWREELRRRDEEKRAKQSSEATSSDSNRILPSLSRSIGMSSPKITLRVRGW